MIFSVLNCAFHSMLYMRAPYCIPAEISYLFESWLLPKIVKQEYSNGFLAEPFHSYIDSIKIVVSTRVGWCFFLCRCG